ncbi:MAG: hypothetical protein WBD24_03825 [Candidatus Omnitrophota bacterium]
MLLRGKHFLVIFFSSLIILIVLISTIIGYILYVEWKNSNFIARYNRSISKLTAEMFRDEILISNVNIGIEKNGPFSGMPFIEGGLKNNSPKAITAILLELSFLDPAGAVTYKVWLHPVGDERFHTSTLAGVEHTRNVLLPGDSIAFRHMLRNCPPEIVEQFSSKSKFAKSSSKDKVKLEYKITGMTVL